jgi:cyclopropane fatty-acyl-phospholipid synthase-like methyltransferase
MNVSRPAWLLDELAHAGPEHLDAGFVQIYDQKQAFDPTPVVEQLRRLGLSEADTLLDFGAGTGTIAIAAAPYCRRVVAVDISPAMRAALTAKIERAAVSNVEIVAQGLLTYEHQGAPAGFAVSRNVLHQLPDFWKAFALRRIASALKPGGVLLLHDLVYSFEPAESERVLGAWFAWAEQRQADWSDRPEAGYTRADYETHVRTEFSTFSWLLEPILNHCGFAIEDHWYSDSRVFAAYTCRRR